MLRDLWPLGTWRAEQDWDSPLVPPNAAGIGYRRRAMRFPCTGHWTIALPGYFYSRVEEDGSKLLSCFGERVVHASSFDLAGKDGSSVGVHQIMKSNAERMAGRAGEPISFEDGHLVGEGRLEYVEEEGESYWQLSGAVATDGTLCIVTICYDDSADRSWAIDTFRSVKHPPARKDSELQPS